jgi:hypothetical protein
LFGGICGTYLLIPINIKDEHWMVATVDFKETSVKVYDSMRNESNGSEAHSFALLLIQFVKFVWKQLYTNECDSHWAIHWPKWLNDARQFDSYSCGGHSCFFINNLRRGQVDFAIDAQMVKGLRNTIVLIMATMGVKQANWSVELGIMNETSDSAFEESSEVQMFDIPPEVPQRAIRQGKGGNLNKYARPK